MHSAQERALCRVISGCVVHSVSNQPQSQPTELGLDGERAVLS